MGRARDALSPADLSPRPRKRTRTAFGLSNESAHDSERNNVSSNGRNHPNVPETRSSRRLTAKNSSGCFAADHHDHPTNAFGESNRENCEHAVEKKHSSDSMGPQQAPSRTSQLDEEGHALVIGKEVASRIGPEGTKSLDPVEVIIVALAPEPPESPRRAYVHYVGLDRRLDKWVGVEDILPWDAIVRKSSHSSIDERVSSRSTRVSSSDPSSSGVPKVTRSRRRALEELNPVSEKEIGNEAVARMERAREEHTKVRNVGVIAFGAYSVDTWYFSPYPGIYGESDILYICEYCLKYMRSPLRFKQHREHCTWRSPPGCLIYSDLERSVSVYEVDGLVNVAYCQRLCLLGKLFLDHKTLYFDVAPFLFYVVLLQNELTGFFSKEKPLVASEFNLACIVTLPQHQRKGVGRFLIALSYELTKREGKTGAPERPLSDLGQLSYRSYWMYAVMNFMKTKRGAVGVSADDVANATGIRVNDVTATLKSMGILRIWKGETYVETNIKSLDQAQRRTKNPTLPLLTGFLNWDVLKKVENAVPASSPKQSPSIASTRVRRKHRRTGSGDGKNIPQSAGACSSQPLDSVGKGSHSMVNSLGKEGGSTGPIYTAGAFSLEEINAMKEFILYHTAEKVHAPLGSEQGLKSVDVRTLAESLNMTMERCRKKLKRMSAAALSDPSVLLIAKKSETDSARNRAESSVQGSAVAAGSQVANSILDAPKTADFFGSDGGNERIWERNGQSVSARNVDSLRVTSEQLLVTSSNSNIADFVSAGHQTSIAGFAHTPDSLTETVGGGITPAASPDIDFDRSKIAMPPEIDVCSARNDFLMQSGSKPDSRDDLTDLGCSSEGTLGMAALKTKLDDNVIASQSGADLGVPVDSAGVSGQEQSSSLAGDDSRPNAIGNAAPVT